MSDVPSAYVIHLVNPEYTKVRFIEGLPGLTQYYINFYCRKRPKKFRLFTRIPAGFKVCKTCTVRKTHGPREQDDHISLED